MATPLVPVLFATSPFSTTPATANKANLYPAIFKNNFGQVVGNQRHVNAGAIQFISCKSCTLQQQVGLVSVNLETMPFSLPRSMGSKAVPNFKVASWSALQ